jgi:uncharacterized protein (TIGR00251 family)
VSDVQALRIEAHAAGLMFKVRAQPGASRERIAGLHGDALKVAVQAPPERGRANEAIRDLLAGALKVPSRDVVLVSGETSRDKRFAVRGLHGDVLRSRLLEAIR